MTAITSSGSVSGLDVNSLVTQLVAADRAPADNRLATADAKLTTQLSAMGQLMGAMSGFQSALASMKDASSYALRQATVGDPTAFTATAGSTAVAGTYDVEIVQLAKAAQLKSTPFTGGATAVVGTGTLVLSMGAASFNITLAAPKNTLADIRDAINTAAGNPGINAALVSGVNGAQLVLTGTATGAANAIKITTSGGDGGLQQLVYDPPITTAMTSVNAAQDAIVNVSGITVNSASNSVGSAIDGVTLNLLKAVAGTTVSLSVANDNSGVQAKVTSFVSAYNVLANQIAKLRSYDASTKAAGPMLGDAMLLNIESQMRRLMSTSVAGVTGPYTTLSSLGITTTSAGTLTADSTKLQAALTANPAAVSAVFGSTNGIATRLYSFLDSHLSSTGDMTQRNASITASRKALTTQKQALDDRMTIIQARYQKQFTALDALMTQMQSTASYLAKQLATTTSS
ncbi:MAG: flagellar filament capping protein FliD [Pseudomonadota bacterium]